MQLLKDNDVSLVFLDIMMPFLNGFQVIEKAPDKNYIIITAYDSFEYAQQALRMGAKDIILKPIEYKQLVQAITRAVGYKFTGNATLDEIVEYIHIHYAEDIDLQKLANVFYISASHISRLFKQYLGTTNMHYIHEIRIQNAIKLLEEGGVSIKEAAERTGYESLNNFYKYFKKFTGTTPAVYTHKHN